MVANHQRAAGRAVQSHPDPESVQGSLVLPRPSGNARVLRPVVRRCGVAQFHYRRPHAGAVPGYQSEREWLLHLPRADVRNSDLLHRISRAVGFLHHHRHLLSRPRLELVLAWPVLGSAHGGGAYQRRPAIYVRVPRLYAVRPVRTLPDWRLLRGRYGAVLLVGTPTPRQ